MSATITTTADITTQARQYLRDFPQYFEEAYQPIQQSTIRLGHPLISEIEVLDAATGAEIDNYDINWRNGILKLHNPSATPDGIYVRGYHYEWFLNEDLAYFADVVVIEHLYDRAGNDTFADLPEEEQHIIVIGTVMNALWSLVTEFSTQIDVSTPEGMMIPAHMRFQQVLQLFQYWKGKYDEMAAATNTGIMHIGIGELRRVARLTNRYVPVFRKQEIDSPSPPIRLFPPIPEIVPAPWETEKPAGASAASYSYIQSPPVGGGGDDAEVGWNEGRWNEGTW